MKTIITIVLLLICFITQARSQAVQQWAANYNNGQTFAQHTVKAFALDNSGNILVTGQAYFSAPTYYDIVTIKYNSSGVSQWVRQINGNGNSTDFVAGIVTDASGNSIVAGTIYNTGTSWDLVIVKYNSAGSIVWSNQYNNASVNGFDNAESIAADNLGNVYVAGTSQGDTTSNDIVIIKYNSSGVQQWVKRYNNQNANENTPSICVSKSGNVFVAGKIGDYTETYFVLKYNSAGTLQWNRSYTSGYYTDERGYYMTIDTLENVFLASNQYGIDYTSEIATTKYNSSGVLQWTAVYSDSSDIVKEIRTDRSGNVYVGGSSQNANNGKSMVTVKYNTAGVQQWANKFSYGDAAETISLAVDVSGNVYAGAVTTSQDTQSDFLTVKYNSSGVIQWSKQYYYRGHLPKDNCYDYPVQILTDNSNVFIAGHSDDSYSSKNYFSLVKYTQPTALVLSLSAFIQGFYNPSTNLMVSDTSRIFLRSSSAPYNIVDSAKGILTSSGTGSFSFFNAVNGVNYYAVIKHRNSLETWSNTAYAFTSNALSLNMTASAAMAYGNNLVQVDASPVRFADYSGDVNQDGNVDAQDLSVIDNDTFNFASGYLNTDVTGNNVTDAADIAIADNNAFNFVSKITPP